MCRTSGPKGERHGRTNERACSVKVFVRCFCGPMNDFIAPVIAVGLGTGRIGNFINGELWGRETDGWWGMIFPDDRLGLVRHPSQLYEATLEGLVLFILMIILFYFLQYICQLEFRGILTIISC